VPGLPSSRMIASPEAQTKASVSASTTAWSRTATITPASSEVQASWGLDSGINDDGGSTATIVSTGLTGSLFQSASKLLVTVQVDDLRPGEAIVLRMDTCLACDPGSGPAGNLQGQLSDGHVAAETAGTINASEQTIRLPHAGGIASKGSPSLVIEKTVTIADGVCGVDDVEELTVTGGDTVKYCYTAGDPGTAALFTRTISVTWPLDSLARP
jgi:hypothetical protein